MRQTQYKPTWYPSCHALNFASVIKSSTKHNGYHSAVLLFTRPLLSRQCESPNHGADGAQTECPHTLLRFHPKSKLRVHMKFQPSTKSKTEWAVKCCQCSHRLTLLIHVARQTRSLKSENTVNTPQAGVTCHSSRMPGILSNYQLLFQYEKACDEKFSSPSLFLHNKMTFTGYHTRWKPGLPLSLKDR